MGEIADLDDGAGKDGDQSSQVDDDSDAADHQVRRAHHLTAVCITVKHVVLCASVVEFL